jgi:hypothetical protein
LISRGSSSASVKLIGKESGRPYHTPFKEIHTLFIFRSPPRNKLRPKLPHRTGEADSCLRYASPVVRDQFQKRIAAKLRRVDAAFGDLATCRPPLFFAVLRASRERRAGHLSRRRHGHEAAYFCDGGRNRGS